MPEISDSQQPAAVSYRKVINKNELLNKQKPGKDENNSKTTEILRDIMNEQRLRKMLDKSL